MEPWPPLNSKELLPRPMLLDCRAYAGAAEHPSADLKIPAIVCPAAKDEMSLLSKNIVNVPQPCVHRQPLLAPDRRASRTRRGELCRSSSPPWIESMTQSTNQSGEGLDQVEDCR